MDIPRLQKTLEAAGFTVQWFPTAQAAKEALVARFAGKTIGMGGSVTLRDLGLYEALSQRGTVYWHWQQPGPETLAQAAKAQVYLTSVNALAETGQLVNIDGTGNRISAAAGAHETVCYLVGRWLALSWPPSSMVCTGKKPPKRLAGPLSSLVRGL